MPKPNEEPTPEPPEEPTEREPTPREAPAVYVRDSAVSEPAAETEDFNGVLHYSFRKEVPAVDKAEPIAFGIENYTVKGVLFDTYILVEQGDSVFCIDQHAAHERILYEKLIRGELRFDSQILMTSCVVNLTPTEHAALMENADRFTELGFEIEEFGPLSVSVHSIPTGAGRDSVEKLLRDMIGCVMKQGSVTELDVVRSSLIQASCKHAIKGGRMLNEYEINELLSHYADGSTPLTCPHGRPVMLSYRRRDFEKLFKRIQ